ncbi:anti-sigma E factor [Photobacterium sp. GB-27]|nr:anti-sigma E factor [Photobacterium sp. GB-56]PSV31799.1 anti-sigma E factor [Photobacterium sp. GB-72]PSV37439.1 anti-sigma E factor [Photobacterium sp. GB-27]PSV39152.1 anti-sigma E factor [Photobacterium sp. GB-210]PSV45378.1 anti-sigma E factor [Photobacterium sp. GB-36]PSV53162.1 anti-sigma E factor [Photobacterium sp. GB-1]PSV57749.1 anti-sigma E factor [Photobacterium sp. GB-3]PSW73753.1 anti-sigma E factor [Photobacterium sp. GB-50]
MLHPTVEKMADKEKISALLDGEELDQSIINALTVDKEDELIWRDYTLIGDVLRGDAPQCKEWNIAANVALALDDEPAHSVGHTETPVAVVAEPISQAIEDQPTPFKAKHTLPSWLTQFGQVAVAACVSLAVIVGVQQYDNEDNSSGSTNNDVPVLQTIPFTGKAEPVSLNTNMASNTDRAPTEAQLMEQRRRINSMLQDYELQLRFNAQDGSLDHSLLKQHNSVAD